MLAPYALAHRILQLSDHHLGVAAGAVEELGQVGQDQGHGDGL